MTTRRIALLPLACVALLTGCGLDEVVNSQRHREDFQYSYDFKPGGRLYVENENGQIQITGWDRDSAEVSGTKSAASKEVCDALKIDIVATGESIRVRTVRPSGHWRSVGVKYVIHVPRRTSIEHGETTNGAIRVDGVQGVARLRTTNGSISVLGKLAGLEAATTNGSVESTFESLPSQRVEMKTTNGSVTAKLPEDLAARVEAETTNGSVRSDFDVTSRDAARRKRLFGVIGGGGPILSLKTTNGSVRLIKLARGGTGGV